MRYVYGFVAQPSPPTRTTAEEIFNLLYSYSKMQDRPWDLSHHGCADGDMAMLGNLNDEVVPMKLKNPNMRSTNCCLHRHLAVKTNTRGLKNILNDCVTPIKYIKSRPLNFYYSFIVNDWKV